MKYEYVLTADGVHEDLEQELGDDVDPSIVEEIMGKHIQAFEEMITEEIYWGWLMDAYHEVLQGRAEEDKDESTV